MTEPTLINDGAVRELAADAASRKRFLRMAGSGAAGSLALLISACGSGDDTGGGNGSADTGTTTPDAPATPTAEAEGGGEGDLEIYALTLERVRQDARDAGGPRRSGAVRQVLTNGRSERARALSSGPGAPEVCGRLRNRPSGVDPPGQIARTWDGEQS